MNFGELKPQDIRKIIEELTFEIENKRNLFQMHKNNNSSEGIPDSSLAIFETIEKEIDELQRKVLQFRALL